MGFMSDVWAWFTTASHWHGETGIPNRVYEHLQLSGFALGAAAAVAIPLGVLLAHRRRGAFVAATVLNIGRAMPSFAIVALALPVSISLGLGLGFWPTWLALFVLAIPPMFTNAVTGVRSVPPDVVEAARGIGMRRRAVLWQVELPLAAPLIVAGVRTAFVAVLATAPLGALVAWGGLGRFIIDGLALRDFPQVAGGALLVAGLAVAAELGLGGLERRLAPRGRRRRAAPGVGPVETARAPGA